MDKIYAGLIELIIRKESLMVGPSVAIGKAQQVLGLKITQKGKVISIKGDPLKVLEDLVAEYQVLLGGMAIKFCKPDVKTYVKKNPEIKPPKILK